MHYRLRLASALLFSVALHALLLVLFAIWQAAVALAPKLIEIDLTSLPLPAPAAAPAPPPQAPVEPRVEAESQPALTIPERQIVNPPEGGEERAPEQTRLLSDRDNRVPEQQVRRGEPAHGEDSRPRPAAKPADKPPARREAAPAPAARGVGQAPGAGSRRAPAAGLKDLLPGAEQLALEGFGDAGGGAQPEQLAKAEVPQRRDLLKHGDPWASGRGGTLDFLPDVREGDITLLNTKAELFAPFVRRVGLRVFQNLVIFLRRDLAAARAATNEAVVAEAVMSPGGEMIGFEFKDRSATGSLGTDRNLQRACQEAFFDRNPPSGAEMADGNIHFLLSTQVQVVAGPEGRALGYRAVFSIGLM